MLSEIIMTVGAERSTSGPVGLAQGVYGTRGNLELVACDAVDGLWVFWFNADAPEDPSDTPDVPPGQWSSGLAFASGRRYLDAQIAQSTLGPDHLEVAALCDDGTLESWYWSPGPGFQRRDTDIAASVSRFRLFHHDGVLTVAVQRADGSTTVVSSGADGYPARRWAVGDGTARTQVTGDGREGPESSTASAPSDAGEHPARTWSTGTTRRPDGTTPTPSDTESRHDGSAVDDPRATELLLARGITDAIPGTARLALSTRGAGTLELTWRSASGHIHHLGLPT